MNNNHHTFITKPKPQPHLRPQYTILPSSTSTITSLSQTAITTTTTTTTPSPTTISTPTTTPLAPTTIIITTTNKPLIVSTTSPVDTSTIVPGKPEKHTAKPGVSAETNQKSIRTLLSAENYYLLFEITIIVRLKLLIVNIIFVILSLRFGAFASETRNSNSGRKKRRVRQLALAGNTNKR